MRTVPLRGRFLRRALLALVAAMVTLATGYHPVLHAQEQRAVEVWGRILLAGDTLPLPGSLVDLVGQRASVTATGSGFYRLTGLKAGTDSLRVRRLGYRTITLAVDLQDKSTEHIDVHLDRLPATLTTVRVEGELRSFPPRFEDVYRRMSTSNGTFFTREDIERLNPPDLPSLLSRVPTLRVNFEGLHFAKCEPGAAHSLVLGGGKENTGVQIYIDGYRMTGRIRNDPLTGFNEQRDVLKLVNPTQIQAIEVYSGVSRIPGVFMEDACAVLAIWTKSY